MRRQEAATLLGVSVDATTEEVNDAWREAVRRAHPDHGGNGDISLLKKARSVLSRGGVSGSKTQKCGYCNGRGYQRTKRGGKIRCAPCNGTGYIRRGE